MTRRKSLCVKWTLVLLVSVLFSPVYTRPQDSAPPEVVFPTISVSTEPTLRETDQKITAATLLNSAPASNTPRDVKTKVPIHESIKTVANQLLDNPENISAERPVVADIRIPPKINTQVNHKHKIKTRNEDGVSLDNGHIGEAFPVTVEEIDSENKLNDGINESSTSTDGISTWILLSNPSNITSVSTEATKIQDVQKKQKLASKNKTKRPQNNKTPLVKRPATIGSTNKADLVAGGSAINENVYNKIKNTVLSNVQKNKSSTTQKPTATTIAPITQLSTTKIEVTKSPLEKLTTKKKKNKNKQKPTTTEEPISSESALLPMEPKEQEIELEISTPATTTKKPKRTTTRKKTKTKKRKTSTAKPEETSLTEVKTTSNKTKSAKPGKKPIETGAITTQLYNYFSREVMPSVGVGVLGLASLVGIAGYFLYPFASPVRRTFEVDKKDDIYKYNGEEYASEGNGQAEEEMLGTVLAGMPTHAKQKINPYAGQTPHINRYHVKKDHDLRYRHVAGYDPNYSRYPQQKTGIAHAAVYTKPVNYAPQLYDTRHAYTTERNKYNYEKPQSHTPYPAVEPIYAAPQTGSGISSFGSDTSSSVVYGVKPSSDSDFKPVYPYEAQFYSDSTNSPEVPTSMYLGSNNEEHETEIENSSVSSESEDNKFVVGNVPKELVDSATPAVVPEHGPRKIKKRSISSSLEEILRAEKENKDIFISNEIDDSYSFPIRNLAPMADPLPINDASKSKDVIPIYAVSMDPTENQKPNTLTTTKSEVVESVSTLPINNDKETQTTDLSNELETTTKSFRVYEVFPTTNSDSDGRPIFKESTKSSVTSQTVNTVTETTDIYKTETISNSLPSTTEVAPSKPNPTSNPDVITYPPSSQSGGFFSFLQRLIDFKFRLGLSILQTTSDSLNKYLRNMENRVQKVAKASQK